MVILMVKTQAEDQLTDMLHELSQKGSNAGRRGKVFSYSHFIHLLHVLRPPVKSYLSEFSFLFLFACAHVHSQVCARACQPKRK